MAFNRFYTIVSHNYITCYISFCFDDFSCLDQAGLIFDLSFASMFNLISILKDQPHSLLFRLIFLYVFFILETFIPLDHSLVIFSCRFVIFKLLQKRRLSIRNDRTNLKTNTKQYYGPIHGFVVFQYFFINYIINNNSTIIFAGFVKIMRIFIQIQL